MAERRMFAKAIVESARFLKMPASCQNLYFHLGLNADDDGVVEAYPIINLIKAHEDDLRVLYSKGFIRILNDDLVTYIEDWRTQNRIRADRKRDSIYKDLLLQINPDVELLEKKKRTDSKKNNGPSTDGAWAAQCSVGKDSIGKDSIGECSVTSVDTHTIKYQLDQECLTEADYEFLIGTYPREKVDGIIHRVLTKPYHGCLNRKKISSWCDEQATDVCVPVVGEKSFHAEQLAKLANERVGELNVE